MMLMTSAMQTLALTVGANGLPGEWTSGDIGQVGSAGATSEENGRWVVSGSGSDIWGTADSFQFAYHELSGDGVLTARIEKLEATDEWAKAGLMIRGSADPGAAMCMLVATPLHGVLVQYRPWPGGGCEGNERWQMVDPPQWLRLTRAGATLTAERSDDGQTWVRVHRTYITMGDPVLFGFCVTAHDNGKTALAAFTNVTLEGA